MKSGSFYKIGDNDQRPWGTWHVLDIGDRHVVKRIVVNPGERLSLQYHNHRSERWTAVSGQGIAEIDGIEHSLQLGHTVDIPLMATHRLHAPAMHRWFSSRSNMVNCLMRATSSGSAMITIESDIEAVSIE